MVDLEACQAALDDISRRLTRLDASFSENDHPRDNEGKFSSIGEVAEHHGYQKTAAKTYSLAKAGKNWSAKAGHRVTETYRHPDTGHSLTVKAPNWKHNFAKSGGNSKSGVGHLELYEHLQSRVRKDG